jgi:hypothetical protein
LGRAIGDSVHIKELSLCGNFWDFGANIKKEHLLALLPESRLPSFPARISPTNFLKEVHGVRKNLNMMSQIWI